MIGFNIQISFISLVLAQTELITLPPGGGWRRGGRSGAPAPAPSSPKPQAVLSWAASLPHRPAPHLPLLTPRSTRGDGGRQQGWREGTETPAALCSPRCGGGEEADKEGWARDRAKTALRQGRAWSHFPLLEVHGPGRTQVQDAGKEWTGGNQAKSGPSL